VREASARGAAACILRLDALRRVAEIGLETTGQHGDDGMPSRVIKRYANRKLYDTRDSKYVTLLQIAQFVRDGEDVRIIDNTTKEDLTNVTLAQIIYEEEKNAADSKQATTASVGTLRQLIQQSGERLMTTLREGPVGKLIARKGEAVAEDPPAIELSPEPETPPKRSVFASSKDALDELQRLADDRMRGLLGQAITHVQQLQGEVKRLQGRIEELEDRLVKLSRRRKEDEPEDGAPVKDE
jgi:polyhydroxyalkanoate synthesis repressor PhaR